jgi:hypothetical protein
MKQRALDARKGLFLKIKRLSARPSAGRRISRLKAEWKRAMEVHSQKYSPAPPNCNPKTASSLHTAVISKYGLPDLSKSRMNKIYNFVLLLSIIIFYFLPLGESATGGRWGCLLSQPVTQVRVRSYPSQVSYSRFQVSIGGTGTDVAHSIVQTTDGGYALGGYTFSFGGGRAYIVKIDASGMIQWTRTFGGSAWPDDIGSVIQTSDGGYIAAGTSIFKLDKNGTLQWCKNFSGESYSVIQTSDNGYALAGYTDSLGAGQTDMFIVKLDSSGALQWARTVGCTGADYAYSIVQTSDGGYAVTGTGCSGIGLITVVKLNSLGSLQWARNFVGEDVSSIIQTADGGYAVAGRGSPEFPFYIVKLDSSGLLQWTRTVWLRDGNIAKSIIQTSDGGYAVVGYTHHIEGYPDWYIVKLDSTGMLQWSKVIGGGMEFGDGAYSIIKTIDGGYAVAGDKDSFEPAGDMYIVKYDSGWNTCGNNDSFVTSQSGTIDSIISVTPTVTSPTGFITPRTPVVGSGGSITAICVTGIQPISNKIPVSFKLYQNYPNPFNPVTKIKFDIPTPLNPPFAKGGTAKPGGFVKLTIFDILGREAAVLVNEELKTGTYEVTWDGENHSSGIYFYRMTTEDKLIDTKKLVLLK